VPTFASPADRQLLDAIQRWKTNAAEAVEYIGLWREAAAKKATFRWPAEPRNFSGNNRLIVAALRGRLPPVDASPVAKLSQAVEAWLRGRSADGLPPQGALNLLLIESADLLQPLEREILIRAGSLPPEAAAGLQAHGGAGSAAVIEPTAPASGGDRPQDDFHEVRELARNTLSGGERRLVDLLLDRGRVPIADVAVLANVKDAKRTKGHVNKKLLRIGWEIHQHDNEWLLGRISPQAVPRQK